jgi:uncharacterized cupin superfamily protein
MAVAAVFRKGRAVACPQQHLAAILDQHQFAFQHIDEFVYVLEGELVLVEDGGETILLAGDCAAFPKGSGNGHHMINRSSTVAVYLEVGSRQPEDLTTCSDIDMQSSNADGRFVRKDGTPY